MPLPYLIPALIGGAIGSATEPPQPAGVPAASALVRALPQAAKRGYLVPPVQGSSVTIDGQTLATAPGLQIRNQQNLIVLPGTVQQAATVRYQIDPSGAVSRIWILTAAEAAAASPQN